jgi:hypothetical protein
MHSIAQNWMLYFFFDAFFFPFFFAAAFLTFRVPLLGPCHPFVM